MRGARINIPLGRRTFDFVRQKHVTARRGALTVKRHIAFRLGMLDGVVAILQLRDAPKGIGAFFRGVLQC